MEQRPIKKADALYVVCYIFVPVLLATAVSALCFAVPMGNAAGALIGVSWIAAILWWCLGGTLLYKRRRKQYEQQLDQMGFVRNSTFYGGSCTVWVDLVHGGLALCFLWNPGTFFVVPAARITNAWVDDGCRGIGIFKGSSRVCFYLIVDGVKVGVPTFTSNRSHSMDSGRIRTGVDKAERMVAALRQAHDTH